MNTMTRITYLIFSILLLASCAQKKKEGNLSIKGAVNNIASELVYIQEFSPTSSSIIDSAIIESDGSFELITNLRDEYSFYRLIFEDQQYVNLVLKGGDKISVEGDGSNLNQEHIITGSEQSKYLRQLLIYQYKNFFVQDSLKKEMKVFNQARDMGGYVQALQLSRLKQQEYIGKLKSFIDNTPASLASLVAAEQLDPNTDFEHMDKALQGLKEIVPNSKYFSNFDTKLEQFRRLAVNAVAPELAFNDPSGKPIKLSDYRGKYVLIDFWASWCKPCRAENPNVVKVYEQYKEKGFEIVGVSLDQKKDAWVKAIEKDNITWPQMSDLGGWQSMPAKIYNISSIPATILLDKEGVIIAKNLRGTSLEDKLSELFAQYE